MKTLREISNSEQIEAHRAEFLTWWNKHVEPLIPNHRHLDRAISRHAYWQEWKRKHGLEK